MGRMRWLLALAGVPALAFPLFAQLVPLPPPRSQSPENSRAALERESHPDREGARRRFGAYFGGWSSPYSYAPRRSWRFDHGWLDFSWPLPTRVIVAQPIVIVNESSPPAIDDSRYDVFLPRRRLPADAGNQPPDQAPAAPAAPPRAAEPLPPPAKAEPAATEKPKPAPLPAPAPAPPFVPPAEPEDHDPPQIKLGKRAFAQQEYGRAERHFAQAIVTTPDARSHFLLAQALFARGRYAEAAAEIQAGLRLRPDWPASRFRPRDLYGDHAADLAAQLVHLEDLMAENPRDPVLLFLYAYQLWFDGRVDDARLWFERAATVGSDRAIAGLFLQSPPPLPSK
jgi:hypothetical protein